MKSKVEIKDGYVVNLDTGEIDRAKELSLDEWVNYSKYLYGEMRALSRGSDRYKELRDELGYCLLELRKLCKARGKGWKKALKEIGLLRKTANRWIKYVDEGYKLKWL